jgi:hypothetical protein
MAFGFAAVWIVASLTAAVVCLSAAALGYGAILAAERTRTTLDSRAGKPGISTPSQLEPRTPNPEEQIPLDADELNHDLGYVYEPTATTPPRAVEPESGGPPDHAAAPSDAP